MIIFYVAQHSGRDAFVVYDFPHRCSSSDDHLLLRALVQVIQILGLLRIEKYFMRYFPGESYFSPGNTL